MSEDNEWMLHYYDVPEGEKKQDDGVCNHSEGPCKVAWCPKCHKEKLHIFTRIEGMRIYEVQSCVECRYYYRTPLIGGMMI
jgi:hypothetical protein